MCGPQPSGRRLFTLHERAGHARPLQTQYTKKRSALRGRSSLIIGMRCYLPRTALM